jgi:hypothetical protein
MSTDDAPALQVGKPVPLHPTYLADQTARKFWQASYRCGRDFLGGPDAKGQTVLVQHEREEKAGFDRRLRLTKPRNFVGPVLRRYKGLVFRKPPTRAVVDLPLHAELVKDATGSGESLDQFFERALLLAQIEREVWIRADTEGEVEGPVTQAQAKAAGTRPVLCLVRASQVLNWIEDEEGQPEEVWVQQEDGEGRPVVRVFREEDFYDAILKKDAGASTLVVESVSAPVVHGYDGVPLVRLRPAFDPLGTEAGSEGESQAGPLAESQQAIVNLISLLNEEISNVTFSQVVLFGVSADMVKDAQVGTNRLLCVPAQSGSVTTIGADPAQAASIRDQVADETRNLMRLAGLTPPDASPIQSSGIALAFQHDDLATIVAALARACEDCEEQVMRLIAGAWGWSVDSTALRPSYGGGDTDLPNFSAEADDMVKMISNTSIPGVIREKAVLRFATRNLSLSDDEKKRLVQETANAGALARSLSAAPPAGYPFPPAKNPPPPTPTPA